MGAVIEWDWLDRKYCDGEIRGEDGSWRSLFALLRAGVLLLLLLLRSRMRSRHLARPRDPLTLALATTCSQSPSPCAITIANTANTATTTTPPHSLRSIYSHHRRRAPSILEPSFRVSHLRLCAPRKPRLLYIQKHIHGLTRLPLRRHGCHPE